MALNKVFQTDQKDHRVRVVPSGTKSGDALIIGDRPAVALTDRGDETRTETRGGVTVTFPSGGVGLADDEASVTFSGSFEFPVTGALTSTGNDVAVYITSAGALTLTVGTNTLFGHTDYPKDYVKRAGIAVVRIGA